MKALFFLLLPLYSYAQTYKMEVDLINSLLISKEKTGPEALEMKKNLDEACDSGRTYPLLPYDTTSGTFNFTYILNCPDVSKNDAFKRVKQWCSLRYADVDAVVRHEDMEAGKLIIKGYTPITYTKTFQGWWGKKRSYSQRSNCYHTIIFTCIDGKIKMEVNDLRYSFVWSGHYSSLTNSYVGAEETQIYLNSMFPIMINDRKEWAGLLELARQTVQVYGRHSEDLRNYVVNWKNDYKF